MLSHEKGPTQAEKMGSDMVRYLGLRRHAETRRGNTRNKGEQENSCNKWWATTRGGAATHCVSQPRRLEIRLRKCRSQGRAAPVWIDDLDRRVWVNFVFTNTFQGYDGIRQ